MSEKITAYHGTVWERPFSDKDADIESSTVFNNLRTNMNDLNAFYASNQEDICEFFSDQKFGHDHELFIQAMLKIEIDAEKVCTQEHSFGKNTIFNNQSYDYSDNDDRIRLYDVLRSQGYQALIMKSDYRLDDNSTADDIAILDEECFEAVAVKFKINGEWGDYMNYASAKEVMKDWHNNPDQYNGIDTFDFDSHEDLGFNF